MAEGAGKKKEEREEKKLGEAKERQKREGWLGSERGEVKKRKKEAIQPASSSSLLSSSTPALSACISPTFHHIPLPSSLPLSLPSLSCLPFPPSLHQHHSQSPPNLKRILLHCFPQTVTRGPLGALPRSDWQATGPGSLLRLGSGFPSNLNLKPAPGHAPTDGCQCHWHVVPSMPSLSCRGHSVAHRHGVRVSTGHDHDTVTSRSHKPGSSLAGGSRASLTARLVTVT